MAAELTRSVFTSSVFYKDAKAALAWLERAFGFELAMMVTDDDGNIGHAEMRYADALISIGGEWKDVGVSPASIGDKRTQMVRVNLAEDLDAHCERARKAGARIYMEPAEQFYGDRTYSAKDPEGHIWSFSRKTRDVSLDEMKRTSGYTVKAFP